VFALLALALAATLLFAANASAEYKYRGQIADSSEMDVPRRVAVEQSTGNAFFVDEASDRVLVYEPTGLTASPLTEIGVGLLDDPYGIAIDETGGQTSIYVSDAGNNLIVRFLSNEAATPTFTVDGSYTSPAQGTEVDEVENFASPLAIAPNGDLWVADRGADLVKRFDPSGAHVSGFDGSTSPKGAFTGLLDIAANSEGDLYVIDTTGEIAKSEGTSRVERFSDTGAFKATIGPLGPFERSATVAVNPSDDSIAVSGDQDAISRGDFALILHVFDASNSPVEQFQVGLPPQGASFRGLAFHSGLRDVLYMAFGRNWNVSGEEGAGLPGAHVMSEVIAPTASIDPVTGLTATSATIGGKVNPNGLPTAWEVEYRRAGAVNWERTGDRSAGEGTNPVEVAEQLVGLSPGEEYEARLRASSEDGTIQSSIIGFTTDPRAPRITAQSAIAGTTEATLRARINPGGEETTYHFRYGPTASYGQSTAEGTIPVGTGGVNVSAQITGLTPGATYHFRVVAENEEGADSGADETFTTLASAADSCPNAQYRTGPEAQLSDCRAYEMVTPIGAEADIRMGGAPSTPDGGTVCFNTENAMLGSDPNGIKLADDGFCAWRGADGWETKWVTGPAPQKRLPALGGNVYFLSEDGERVIFASDQLILRDDYVTSIVSQGTTQMRSYMWEDGETRELSPPQPPLVIPGFGEFYFPENSVEHRRPLAASDDATRGIFQSTVKVLPEDTNFGADIYEWNPDGVRLVSTAEGSAAAAGGEAPFTEDRQLIGTGIISADGNRVFFHHQGAPLDADALPAEAPEAVQSVYMREGDEMTLVSPRRGSGPDAAVEFMGASEDGEKVFLQSTQQLTPEPKGSGAAIYVYDVSRDELDLYADRAGGVELLGMSADGSTVLYRSLATYHVFIARGGDTTLLGTLAADERSFGQEGDTPFRLGSYRPDQRTLRFTPDGSALVFASAGLFAGSTSGVVQVYRWSEEHGLQNISSAGDSEQVEDASIGAYATMVPGHSREEFLAEHRLKALQGRVISDDGSRIFFETAEALVDRDVNGLTDVYEWHDEEVNLVTPGNGGSKGLYHDSSADGKTVFFTTFDRVDPDFDHNNNRDLYVAQPGGGFPPPPAPAACAGEACQQERPAPGAGDPASRSAGEGNVVAAPKIVALGEKQLSKLASRGQTTVKVEVAAAGTVTALLKGKLDGRMRTVAKATKSVKKAGIARLTLKLSKAAREQLEERGKLRLTLEVTHSRADKTARKAVMLRG
jgi:hypothetical protein